MTNYPLQIVGLVPISTSREREHAGTRSEPQRDVQWGTPIFRAPVLPTSHQIHGELPFTANLPRQFRARSLRG